MQAPMIVKICDLSEGLATVDALIGPIVCVDALMVPQIGRLREAYKNRNLIFHNYMTIPDANGTLLPLLPPS